MLSEMPDMVSRVVLGTATLAADSGAVGNVMAWPGLAWLGLAWVSGREVTPPNTLPDMVGLSGCLRSFPGGNLLTKNKLSFIQARKMQVLLPDMMGILQVGSADLKIKTLMFFKNVMGKPTTFQNLDEAVGSPITGQLMENLPLLFDLVRLMWGPEP